MMTISNRPVAAVATSALALALFTNLALAKEKTPELSNQVGQGIAAAISAGTTKDSSGCDNAPELFCGDIEPGFLGGNGDCVVTHPADELSNQVFLDSYRIQLPAFQNVIISMSAQFSTADFGEDQLDSFLFLFEDTNADGSAQGEPRIAQNDDNGFPEFAARNSTIEGSFGGTDFIIGASSFGEMQDGNYSISVTCFDGPGQVPNASHTGVWETVNHNGSGFPLHILPDDRALAYWFNYRNGGMGPDSNTSFWAALPGDIVGDQILFDIVDLQGPGFGPNYQPNELGARILGQGRMRTLECGKGFFEFFSEEPFDFPSFAMSLNKFASVPGLNCNQ